MRESILVVEDEKILRVTLEDALKAEGYAVLSVLDGNDALAALEEGAFSLVITDIRLPNAGGLRNIEEMYSRVTHNTGDNDDRIRKYKRRGRGHANWGV